MNSASNEAPPWPARSYSSVPDASTNMPMMWVPNPTPLMNTGPPIINGAPVSYIMSQDQVPVTHYGTGASLNTASEIYNDNSSSDESLIIGGAPKGKGKAKSGVKSIKKPAKPKKKQPKKK